MITIFFSTHKYQLQYQGILIIYILYKENKLLQNTSTNLKATDFL